MIRGLILWYLTLFCTSLALAQSTDFQVTALVDPFFGSEQGNVFVGASVPFGLVKLGANIAAPQPTSGYRSNKPIIGFSHTHTSGTGGASRYGNILVRPQTGKPDLTDFASISRHSEMAFPGYYSIVLARYTGDVKAELTATANVGVHRYTFWDWSKKDGVESSIFVDIAHTLKRLRDDDAICTDAQLTFIDAQTIQGSAAFEGGWGGKSPYQLYFYLTLDTPPNQAGIWRDSSLFLGKASIQKGENETSLGAYLGFQLPQRSTVEVRVGVSTKNIADAKNRILEQQNNSFEDIRRAADLAWNEPLSRIRVKGGLPEQQRLFYSALRNTMILPTTTSDSTQFWDHYCLWDVHRTVMPLHTLILPNHQRKVVNNLLHIYRDNGWVPDAWLAGDYGQMQGGTNADVLLADAILKKLGGFDEQLAYEAMLKNATQISDTPHRYGRYQKGEAKTGQISRQLEHAYNDFCIEQVAAHLGDSITSKRLQEQSKAILNNFHPESKLFWAKDENGDWIGQPQRKHTRKDHWNDPFFYESSPAIYSTYAPHAMTELMEQHGGRAAYASYLDQLFEDNLFSLENEPAFLIPYQYLYAERPDKTAERVHHLLTNDFELHPRGLPGQDDSGATSSWYVWSAMGLFPVAGQPIYLINTPLFEEVEIQLENGKSFKIIAHRSHPDAILPVRKVLNGELFSGFYLTHEEVTAGGVLEIWVE